MITVNGTPVSATHFAYDGCHKIYLLELPGDADEARDGYSINPVAELPETWRRSCPLRFISDWQLTKSYVRQGERARFGGAI